MVRCDVEIMDSFSAHADRGEITDFVRNQRGSVKRMFLVHGEIKRQESLRAHLLEQGFKQIDIPILGKEYEIG